MKRKYEDENLKLSEKEADKMLAEILNRIKTTLGIKAKEYVRNADRMHNFNVGADMRGVARERIIESFKLKHDVSLEDLLTDLENGIIPSEAYVSEKLGDIINYCILLEMSIKHKIKLHESSKRRGDK